MRRIVTALATTATGLVLLFSYHTSTNSVAAGAGVVATGPVDGGRNGTGSTGGTGDTGSSGGGSGSSGGSTGGGGGSTGGRAARPATPARVTGPVVGTQWGPVQVQLRVSNGRVTAADAIQYPSGNDTDAQINSYAIPVLNQEVVAAQSAQIDAVSGATVTSEGYLQSLQAAIDAAHL